MTVNMERTLHLGCGRKPRQSINEVTLDSNPFVNPDVVCDLGVDPLPFDDDSFDNAVAVHVLEHIGRQGETKAWFYFWEELYRVLKPGGTLQFVSPLYTSVWAWADPSHTRALSPESFAFFSQDSYRIEGSAISPFRVRCDFEPVAFNHLADGNFRGVLAAQKPLRAWWQDDTALDALTLTFREGMGLM